MADNFYSFRLGAFECVALSDGGHSMPIERLFPNVPAGELHRVVQARGLEGDVTGGRNLLHVKAGERRVLVDTGFGNGPLAESMAAAGISPGEIDTVFITHGDGDHTGGIANFPNARFVLPQKAWELWTSETGRAQMVDEWDRALGLYMPEEDRARVAAGRARYGRETLPSLRNRLDLVEPEDEFLPGFKLLAAPGHRSDHFVVEISSRDETLIHVADAFSHPLQAIHPEWTAFTDTYSEQAASTAVKLFQRASERNALVFCAHLAFPGLVRVRQANGGWSWESV